MKQIFISFIAIIIAVLVGSLFLQISDDEDIPVINEIDSYKGFQVGIYTSLDTALEEAKNKNSIVIKEDDYYYVYAAILHNNENILKMKKYLDDNNTYYYLKTIILDDEIKEKIESVEKLMLETTSTIAFLKLNTKILESVNTYYEN